MLTRARALLCVLAWLVYHHSPAAEAPGHAGGKEPENAELESELYIGRHGYWHGGLGAVVALGEELHLGLGAHAQREELGATEVSYFNAELIYEFPGELAVEVFGFVYPEVERLQAVGTGLRGTKKFALGEERSLSVFFGPSYARARSVVEESDELETMRHLMLLGGITWEVGEVSVTLLASHSFYNRNPEGVETHVGLTDMTHFAAYENNDGFVRDTVAVEVAWEINEWLELNLRYAAMWFEKETRHAIAITPAVKLSERVELETGVEFLRGGEHENDLVFMGFSVMF
ncbi:hypothetical protein DES53_10354 [Roseimicrobium gellanilyticum]|uniref:Outer membrane beta-barrel porin/alpha-amylase n=1 Tax=Roseimicrobium gellanilyticum TaxID=748857 RepID=A0A366HQC9_9BACT|nr:hypothetical protein [Roseimicrobium gellanilyticum]RBP45059.1 hypothetical protein DES53_10354 [Roseimicrobium gellanilyticum]